ncbi:transcript variant X2, partial [Nothobranchius furzeri]
MKMRRHRVFLLCTVGLCVISFLHYYKALHYVSLLRELSAPYPNIKSFIMVSGFFWREKGVAATPLSPASPEEAPVRQLDNKNGGGVGSLGGGAGGVLDLGVDSVRVGGPGIPGHGGIDERLKDQPEPPHPWEKPEESLIGDLSNERLVKDHHAQPVGPQLPEARLGGKGHPSDPIQLMGDIHTHTHELQDDKTSYFVRTKAGALCFRQGTEVATPKEYAVKIGGAVANEVVEGGRAAQRKALQLRQQPSVMPKAKAKARGNGKRLVKCVCRPGWHGPYCGVPTMVYHSNLPTKERLTPRENPRRVINAINVNHEFDLLHVRFHELAQAVDLFLVCESNFTAYGEKRPLRYDFYLFDGDEEHNAHDPGYCTSKTAPRWSDSSLTAIQTKIRTKLLVPNARPDLSFLGDDPAHPGLFSRIIRGEEQHWRVWEDKDHVAFLTPFPNSPGFTVLVPRRPLTSDIFRLGKTDFEGLVLATKKVAQLLEEGLGAWGVGLIFEAQRYNPSKCLVRQEFVIFFIKLASIHPSIIIRFSGGRIVGPLISAQRPRLPSLQPFQPAPPGNPKARPENLTRVASRRHLNQIPTPPQLA